MKLLFLCIVPIMFVGCSHGNPHAFIAPSSSAIVGDFAVAKKAAVKASQGDKEAAKQVVLEDGGKIEIDPEITRKAINAGVSINAPDGNGQSSISISSESLLIELRDELLAAWEYINRLG